MLPEMDKVARIHVRSWANHGIVDIKEGTSNVKYFLTWFLQYKLLFYQYVCLRVLYLYLYNICVCMYVCGR